MPKNRKTIITDKTDQEIVRALRGDWSQGQLAMKIGTSINQISRWELGKSDLRWEQFVEICIAKKANLIDAAKIIYRPAASARDVYEIPFFLLDRISSDVAADRLDVNRTTVQRWKNRASQPSLNNVLKLVELCFGKTLLSFLSVLLGDSRVESLESELQKHRQLIKIQVESPMALLAHLVLDVFRKDKCYQKGFLSKTMDISLEEETKYVQTLRDTGLISFKKNGHLKVEKIELDISSLPFEQLRNILSFWKSKSAELTRQMPEPPKDAWLGFNLITVSRKASEEIRALQTKCYQEIRKITTDDNLPSEEVLLFDASIIPLAKFPKE